MAAAYYSSVGNATGVTYTTACVTTIVVVSSTVATGTSTSMCSCSPRSTGGFACVSAKHKTKDDLAWEELLKAIERRDEFRRFIGRPAVAVARPPRSCIRAHRDKRLSWKTRALGRLPGHSTASG